MSALLPHYEWFRHELQRYVRVDDEDGAARVRYLFDMFERRILLAETNASRDPPSRVAAEEEARRERHRIGPGVHRIVDGVLYSLVSPEGVAPRVAKKRRRCDGGGVST